MSNPERTVTVTKKETVTTYTAPFTPQQAKALHAAVAAIYFADNSDYLSGLWEVVRHLSPDVAEILEDDPQSAYDATRDQSSGLFDADHLFSTADLRLYAYSEKLGGWSPAFAPELAWHLGECESCREWLKILRATDPVLTDGAAKSENAE